MGGIGPPSLTITALGGGCAGANGANSPQGSGGGVAGQGGGAVLMLGQQIAIGGVVNASGSEVAPGRRAPVAVAVAARGA